MGTLSFLNLTGFLQSINLLTDVRRPIGRNLGVDLLMVYVRGRHEVGQLLDLPPRVAGFLRRCSSDHFDFLFLLRRLLILINGFVSDQILLVGAFP